MLDSRNSVCYSQYDAARHLLITYVLLPEMGQEMKGETDGTATKQ